MAKDEQLNKQDHTDIFDITPDEPAKDFPVVGIGTSAGGVDVLKRFFSNTSPNSGMAFVSIIHLSPDKQSMMPDILKKITNMPVYEIENGMEVEINTVYLNPSDKDVKLEGGKFSLIDIHGEHSGRLPIDRFLRSLAKDQGRNAICVILTGTGTDGTQGLKAIKEELGLVIAQSLADAEYTGMPKSAINSGLVDIEMPVDGIPKKLQDYVERTESVLPDEQNQEDTVKKNLDTVFSVLKNQTGNDFSNYKISTVSRRIRRRMNVHQIDELSDYIKYLYRNRDEVHKLFKELLISVTNFFRDPDSFSKLKEEVVQTLIENQGNNDTLRIWVPGCATGEEAYSIAILLHEVMHELGKTLNVQIFATDLDMDAINMARKGLYPDSISVDVGQRRLQKYFIKEGDYFRVKKEIREMLIFAEQNIIKDPPFTNLNLVSCRNVLIYLDSAIQKKLIPLLHYSLNTDGFLFMGSSESTGNFDNLFEAVDKKHKIYRNKEVHDNYSSLLNFPLGNGGHPAKQTVQLRQPNTNITEMAENSLLQRYAPPSLVIDRKGNIHYVHGRTGQFLEPASGEARMNIYEMARKGLNIELAGALNRVFSGKEEEVRYPEIRVKTNGDTLRINLHVSAIHSDSDEIEFAMVGFEEIPDPEENSETAPSLDGDDEHKSHRIEELENELRNIRESLQTKVEEYQTTNEELKSSNEELQSANEELQSTNEELETAKEEMQSLNEELETVNDELQDKNDELSHAHNDLKNLMNSIDIPVIFMDNELQVKRFTEPARDLINLIEEDIGRPINHISTSLQDVNLEDEAARVLDDLHQIEKDIQSHNGNWYRMHVMPYRTLDNVIDGVVFTFTDIHDQKEANKKLKDVNRELRREREFAEEIIKTVRQPLLVLNEKLQVILANPAFYDKFSAAKESTVGHMFYEIQDGQWEIEELRKLLEEVLPEKSELNDFRIDTNFPGIGQKRILLSAREIATPKEKNKRILLSIEDLSQNDD